MKQFATLLATLALLWSCAKQPSTDAAATQLRFRDGKFRIAQFTDIHIHPTDPKSAPVADTLLAVLERERPDLVVMTGDIVTMRPAAQGWKYIMDMMAKAGIPYAVTMGNHDPEAMQRDSIFDILATDPLFVGEKGPANLKGCGTYVLPVLGTASDKVSALIYCLDSNDYPEEPTHGGYAWIEHDKISWYRQTSQRYTEQNGGKPLPALAFFHIATPEFRAVDETTGMLGSNKEGSGVGAPELNSGMLTSCAEMGDVMGIFVGHDHDNDYIGQHYGIALGYGRVSGFNAYGDMERGARIIEMQEGEHTFDTWISTPTGQSLTYYYPSGITLEQLQNYTYLPAIAAQRGEQGVAYKYFVGDIRHIGDIHTKGKLVSTGVKPNFTADAEDDDHYAYEYNALIDIPQRDVYIIHTRCDDGAMIFIDDQLVVDCSEAHSMSKQYKGVVALERGLHRVRILYYENYMGEGLDIRVESRTLPQQPIPDAILYVAK